MLFRLAAFAEAAGWTLLISGILSERYIWKTSKIPVLITGQLHGMSFLTYFAAVLVLSPSLNWKLGKTMLATLCGVLPYGSLILEVILAHNFKKADFANLYFICVYRRLVAPQTL
jgi:integral membrane protein